jgi:hypothetical protein
MGVRGPKKHQKKLPEMGFFQILTTGGPIYIYIYIYIYKYIYYIYIYIYILLLKTTLYNI